MLSHDFAKLLIAFFPAGDDSGLQDLHRFLDLGVTPLDEFIRRVVDVHVAGTGRDEGLTTARL